MSRKSKAAEFLEEGYSLNVTGRNVQVTEPMKAYALEKISKIEKYNIRIIDINVMMDIQKLDHRIEIIIKADHVKIISRANTENMYASIDKAVDKIQAQLRKYRERIREHQAKHIATIDMNVNVLQRSTLEQDMEDELSEINGNFEDQRSQGLVEKYRHGNIVKRETMPLKILTYQEAIMKMELSDDPFMLFRNEEDMKLKVIYRREDGDFGVIEPEA